MACDCGVHIEQRAVGVEHECAYGHHDLRVSSRPSAKHESRDPVNTDGAVKARLAFTGSRVSLRSPGMTVVSPRTTVVMSAISVFHGQRRTKSPKDATQTQERADGGERLVQDL